MGRKLSFFKKISKGLDLIVLACILTGLLHANLCFSQSGPDPVAGDIQGNRSKADTVQKEIREKKDQISALTKKERKLVSELKGLDRTVDQADHRLQSLLAEESYLMEQTQETEEERVRLQKEIEVLEEDAKDRLIACYKLGRLGIVSLLFSARSFSDLERRSCDLEIIVSNDVRLWHKVQKKRAELDLLTTFLENRRRDIQRIKTSVSEEQRAIAEKKRKRTGLLAHIHDRKESALSALEELTEASRRLDDAIRGLEDSTEKTRQDLPLFTAKKGRLPMPVKGSVVSSFGRYKDPRFDIYHFRNGIEIKAGKEAPIRAVHAGNVLYAGWFKGYGNIIVIDHGQGYYSLSAHALSLAKKVGESVKNGEIIGVVGDTGSLEDPCLYFEIRYHGKPVNPEVWIKGATGVTHGCRQQENPCLSRLFSCPQFLTSYNPT